MALADSIQERRSAEERAADLRAGLVASAVYNTNKKKGSKPIKPGDFFENGKSKRREQTWEEVENVMQVIMIRQKAAKEREAA